MDDFKDCLSVSFDCRDGILRINAVDGFFKGVSVVFEVVFERVYL